MWLLFLCGFAPILQLASLENAVPKNTLGLPVHLSYPSSEKLCIDLGNFQKSVVLNITFETKTDTRVLLDKFIWHKEQFNCFIFPMSVCVSMLDLL